jgi:hypothetical protein
MGKSSLTPPSESLLLQGRLILAADAVHVIAERLRDLERQLHAAEDNIREIAKDIERISPAPEMARRLQRHQRKTRSS